MGTLYVVATPLGNLEDITLRALRVLRESRLIAAEDTRHTRRLLDRYDISTPTISYHEHNKLARRDDLLAALAEGDIALVCDAGTPAINDPGYELVVAAIEAGFAVAPVPGPSAPLAALVGSGLPTEQWTFLGFLPNRRKERRDFLERYATYSTTLICFETPHRLREALPDIRDVLGERRICVARELTKVHEEWVRGTVSEVLTHFTANNPRGEFVLVIEGYLAPVAATEPPIDWQQTAQLRLQQLHDEGMTGTAAAKRVAKELGVARSDVYDLWVALSDSATTE
jgi:16S rRNA (cytidine1402-2'-O)-methyltransferase